MKNDGSSFKPPYSSSSKTFLHLQHVVVTIFIKGQNWVIFTVIKHYLLVIVFFLYLDNSCDVTARTVLWRVTTAVWFCLCHACSVCNNVLVGVSYQLNIYFNESTKCFPGDCCIMLRWLMLFAGFIYQDLILKIICFLPGLKVRWIQHQMNNTSHCVIIYIHKHWRGSVWKTKSTPWWALRATNCSNRLKWSFFVMILSVSYYCGRILELSSLQHCFISAVRKMSKYVGIQRSSWSTQWLQGVQVLWLHNKPKTSALPHSAWQLVWGVCADMTKHLHFGLVCPMDIVPEVLWFIQMQLHKPLAILPCSFKREDDLSCHSSKQAFSKCIVINRNI